LIVYTTSSKIHVLYITNNKTHWIIQMINITFPDNSIKGFENIPTGMDVAKSISDGFARNCVAMKINGQL
jgi:hypothetical protein